MNSNKHAQFTHSPVVIRSSEEIYCLRRLGPGTTVELNPDNEIVQKGDGPTGPEVVVLQ
ncbi:MAG TPA: hypothetical protein VEF35_01990 [Candidatus Bathyarchaeia archaeon]|nr:hypothetical protein [Candidatus Bathyarchaeia archaeon]